MADASERWRPLAAWVPELEQPDFEFGHWAGGERRDDGTLSMPYYEFSDKARALIAALPVVVVSWPDWMQTPRAQELVADHSRIAEATADELLWLTTAIVRSERFTDGSIAGAFESGLLLAVARRAAALAHAP